MTIKVKDFIDTAYSERDADLLDIRIELALSQNSDERIIIDFDGIKKYSEKFFSYVFLSYMRIYGKDKFDKTFGIAHLSECGKTVYTRFYWNALSNVKKYPSDLEWLMQRSTLC